LKGSDIQHGDLLERPYPEKKSAKKINFVSHRKHAEFPLQGQSGRDIQGYKVEQFQYRSE